MTSQYMKFVEGQDGTISVEVTLLARNFVHDPKIKITIKNVKEELKKSGFDVLCCLHNDYASNINNRRLNAIWKFKLNGNSKGTEQDQEEFMEDKEGPGDTFVVPESNEKEGSSNENKKKRIRRSDILESTEKSGKK